jgi:hypothetical protein
MAEPKLRKTPAPHGGYGDELKIEDWMPIRQEQVRTGAAGNPFLPEARPTLGHRPVLDDVRGPTQKPVDTIARRQGLIGPGQSLGDGYRLTPQEHLMLAQAPKKPPGTQVTIRAYPIRKIGGIADHMYEEYDDGREQYIYRGGPRDGLLHAEVTPARASRDYGQGTRVLDEHFIPAVPASDAIRSAEADARRVNASRTRYGVIADNSNTLIGNHSARRFGERAGDAQTIGALTDSRTPIPGVYAATMPVW